MITLNMNFLNVTLITQGYWGGGGNDNIKHEYFECNTDYTRLLGRGEGVRISLFNMYILNVTLKHWLHKFWMYVHWLHKVIGGGGCKNNIKHVYFEYSTDYTMLIHTIEYFLSYFRFT